MESYTSESDNGDGTDDRNTVDMSYMPFHPEELKHHLGNISCPSEINTLLLYHGQLKDVPSNLGRFLNLHYLDISSNHLTSLPEYICECPLTTLIAKNNQLSEKGLPASFSKLVNLRELNLNGNQFHIFPSEVLDLENLKYLYLGGNKISEIPRNIVKLQNLNVLSIGSNQLQDVPAVLGTLKNLTALVLSDNQLVSLPASIAKLDKLKSLLLHKNRLRLLPTEIVSLKCLTELSLRDNPLVVRFVSDMTHTVPSLLELAARTVKLHNVSYYDTQLPKSLGAYLSSAHHCINPKCQGVFFDNRVEHVKFVDFCGKYRVPLLQYLCSAKCIDDKDDKNVDRVLLRKVLLG